MTRREAARRAPALGAVLLLTCAAAAQESRPDIVLREGLVLDRGAAARRAPFSIDPVAEAIVRGTWKAPAAGEKIAFPGGATREWTPVKADGDGWISDEALRHGYASFVVQSDVEEVRVLDATGHSMVFVNGEPRAGDPYQYGFVRLPVQLAKGPNVLLFACERNGKMRAALTSPRAPLTIEPDDPTLPDSADVPPSSTWAAIVVQNGTLEWLRGLSVVGSISGVSAPPRTVAPIPPLTRKKIPVRIPIVFPPDENLTLTVKLNGQDRSVVASGSYSVRERSESDSRILTFPSAIDGSVQSFALTPGESDAGRVWPTGIVLSLHGAGIDAGSQAACYARKPGVHIVAPTNRRPYGFDWEDWGRLDAIEVLDYATRVLVTKPERTWLTGHSMGGHGTWLLGAMYPDRFAVIAPSAGWRDFFTYGGTRRGSDKDPIREILDRALNTSDSSLLTRNHAQHAVYILHGAKDATVPVSEGRAMRDALAPFHEDFRYHEEPKATHWWGNACVDWPPFFELFSRRTNPRKREKVDFTSVSPGIAGTCYGVTIEQQVKPFAVSRVRAIPSDRESQIRVTTENVARLSVDCRVLGLDAGAALTIDGQRIPAVKSSGARIAHVVRGEAGWERLREPLIGEKSSRRSGPFKDAFRNRFLYVVGTKGTPEENAWALARARYDAETFWVRGNGSVDIALDKDFDPGKERDRSVILLGNADTNAAWKPLLGKSPLQITRDSIRIGDKSLDGSRLGAHFVRPRPGSDVACVAVIGGTGLEGMRLTLRMPIFVSGVAYPDWCVVGPSAEAPGGYGFVAAGFFANDWSVNPSDSAFAPQVK